MTITNQDIIELEKIRKQLTALYMKIGNLFYLKADSVLQEEILLLEKTIDNTKRKVRK